MNEVRLTGTIKEKIALRVTPKGKSVVNFTLDVKRPRVRFYDHMKIVAWGELAERLARNADVDKPIMIVGQIQNRMWKEDGENHFVTEIIASDGDVLPVRMFEDMQAKEDKGSAAEDSADSFMDEIAQMGNDSELPF